MAKKVTPEDIFYDNLTLGLMGTLVKLPRVCNVTCEHRKPCEKAQVVNWEQRHTVYLPEDMKKFYLSTDGFLLQWSYQYALADVRRVGYIHIPHLQQITLLREDFESSSGSRTEMHAKIRTAGQETLIESQGEIPDSTIAVEPGAVGGAAGSVSNNVPDKDRWGNQLPVINAKSKIFEINTVNDVAKVCIIYDASGTNNPKLYLYEMSSMKWTFLSDTFSEYLRMAIAHLGLPYWELCFSNIGLPSWTEQLFMLLAPHLLEDHQPRRDRKIYAVPEHPYNIIDPSIFRIKPKSSTKNASIKKYAT